MLEQVKPNSVPVMMMCFGALGHFANQGLLKMGVIEAISGIQSPLSLQQIVAKTEVKNIELLKQCLMSLVGFGALKQHEEGYQISGIYEEVSARLESAYIALLFSGMAIEEGIYESLPEEGVKLEDVKFAPFTRAFAYLTSSGILLNKNDVVSLTPDAGIFLTAGGPSLVKLVEYFNFRITYWERIPQYLTGEEVDIWPFTNSEEWDLFSGAVGQVTQGSASALVGSFDFSSFHSFADVGSGTGGMALKIAALNPNLKVQLVDLPAVLEGLSDLPDNVSLNPMNVLSDVLPDVEIYLCANIFHVMGDAEVVQILKGMNGRLIIVDFVREASGPFAEVTSLEFWLTAGMGGNRNIREIKSLLSQAGFVFTSMDNLAGPAFIVQAQRR